MNSPLIQGRRSRKTPRRPLAAAVEAPLRAAAVAYPGYSEPDDGAQTRTFLTGSALVHLAGFAVLLFIASLAPVIEEVIIPVQILREDTPPPPPPEPAPAPKAIAQRRNLPFAPAVQAVQPQIVNPRIVAEASPLIAAETLQMDAVGTRAAPTQLNRSATVVERVSAVNTATRAAVAPVDVAGIASPAVRGPLRAQTPVGPSVGPRKVDAAEVADTSGTAPLQIGSGNGSSVAEGMLSARDVVGSPDGALVVSVDTTIGQGALGGTADGGDGTTVEPTSACMRKPEVMSYLGDVKDRTLLRWILPPGIDAGMKVTLRFHLDAAGSPSKVSIVRAQDNALGASAVDALRSAAPFPPMPAGARCLARVPIVGTFSNPVGG